MGKSKSSPEVQAEANVFKDAYEKFAGLGKIQRVVFICGAIFWVLSFAFWVIKPQSQQSLLTPSNVQYQAGPLLNPKTETGVRTNSLGNNGALGDNIGARATNQGDLQQMVKDKPKGYDLPYRTDN